MKTTLTGITPSQMAVRFFLVAAGAYAVAGGLAAGLIGLHHGPSRDDALTLPPAFLASTLLPWTTSIALMRAVAHVRIERQRAFRHNLLAALASGVLFLGMQSFGMWCLLANERIHRASAANEHAFTFMFTALHGLHVTVAMLFLSFVAVQALADRYDHEYHWGVSLCGWFWHALGAVWLAILAVFVIAG